MKGIGRYLRLRLTAAEPDYMISQLASAGLELGDIRYRDVLTVEFTIHNYHLAYLDRVLENTGAEYKIVKKMGALWYAGALCRRPLLILGLALFLLLSGALPGRVLSVRVKGNEAIAQSHILAIAAECGIGFGATKRQVRSEEVKNQLLSKIPQLQWVGVNMDGCTATIHVKERSTGGEIPKEDEGVCAIVAGMDGIITEMTVLKGTALCKVGDSVRMGQTLISGYTDHGLTITAERAEGEVWGYTLRQIGALAPSPAISRGEYRGKHVCRSLRIGKKVIKFCNHSGIPDATCVKMYSENFWVLPGGITLPAALIEETYLYYDTLLPNAQEQLELTWMPSFMEDYLCGQMVAGEILSQEQRWNSGEGICRFTGDYVCRELIGQVKYEETIGENAKDN